MEHATITVEARVLGQRTPLLAGWQVPLDAPPAGEPLRLRDLLAQVVRQEVSAYRQRQEERRLIRVLSPEALGQAIARGKIEMGGPQDPGQGQVAQEVDEDAAVVTALQAFADGLYFVFLDGRQEQDLEATVDLRPASTLTFIRLVALAGG